MELAGILLFHFLGVELEFHRGLAAGPDLPAVGRVQSVGLIAIRGQGHPRRSHDDLGHAVDLFPP